MKYSIITPVYNRADCIGRCIESVIRNLSSGLSLEHIIVDDGSIDGTAEIVKHYASANPHIKFITFECNKGTNAARNVAIASATGDFCIILDSDDYFVDNAVHKIDAIIGNNPEFIHYMFVPNDRVEYIKKNELLGVREIRTLTFLDFLNDKVEGDFTHVIKTTTLQKYPFDESLRIFEGVFFLRFYREARQMLFINEIVTIRERNRNDSVSREFIRTSVDIIRRTVKSITLWIKWFEKDCVDFGLEDLVCKKYISLLENHLLLSDYVAAKNDIGQIKEYNGYIPLWLNTVYCLRVGRMFRFALWFYLNMKYYFLESLFKKMKLTRKSI